MSRGTLTIRCNAVGMVTGIHAENLRPSELVRDAFNSQYFMPLAQLRTLSIVESYMLRGTLPSTWPEHMEQLSFSGVGLHGSIPSELFTSVPTLKVLELISLPYTFRSTLPSEIGLASNLRMFTVASSANVGGSMPSEIGLAHKLHFFSLTETSFSGKIPPSIVNLKALRRCDLQGNREANHWQCPIPSTLPHACRFRKLLTCYEDATNNTATAAHDEELSDAPFALDASFGAENDLQCNRFLQRVRVSDNRSAKPFGRGVHKEAYVGKLDEERDVVVKVPSVLNPLNPRSTDVELLRSTVTARHCHTLSCLERMQWDNFGFEIEEELLWSHRVAARGGSKFIAAYLGGCVGIEYGGKQIVAQKGPYLSLRALLSERNVTSSRHSKLLTFEVRLKIAISVFRLLAHLEKRGIVACSWSSLQLGVDDELNVVLIDLGNMHYHRSGVDAPIFSKVKCSKHADCGMSNSATQHCLHDKEGTHSDRRCENGFCFGLTAASWVQAACQELEPLLVVRSSTEVDVVKVEALSRAFDACNYKNRDLRASAAAMVLKLQRILGSAELSEDFVNSFREKREEWIASAARRCDKYVHC